MEDFLAREYAIYTKETVSIDGKEGFKNKEYTYFIIPSENKEMMYIEQAVLSYYLHENGYLQTAYPIPNRSGKWFTKDKQTSYIVVQLANQRPSSQQSYGHRLADLHQLGRRYRYEPREISSYGQWQRLWIDKLEMFEYQLTEQAKLTPHPYYQLVIDMLPYIIGLSENAIQYVRESEKEQRYHEGDQGTITFHRYRSDLLHSVIWFNELAYDHPARDIAEYIRTQFLETNKTEDDIALFMKDYQMRMPISVFGWRQIYGRLIYPVHLFDVLEKGFFSEDLDEQLEHVMKKVSQQEVYEKRLRSLFKMIEIDNVALRIPVLHWL
ncbi:MAG TPA: hypothetical protein VF095_07960 [Bacillota bacterium]